MYHRDDKKEMSLQKYEIGEAVSKFSAEKMLFAHVFFVLLLFKKIFFGNINHVTRH